MAKRNKKQQRKKGNLKKRNVARARRRLKRDDAPYRDEGLSLAQTGMQDMPAILRWSQVLANEPEFHDPIFDPEACMRAFSDESQALGLDQDETATLPEAELSEKQADLILGIVNRVLGKKEQREIVRRLKRLLKRFGDEGDTEKRARINLLISLTEFAKDERVWGAIGLVSALVMRQVEGIMTVISSGLNHEVEADSVDQLLESLKASPEMARMEQMVARNPGVLDFFTKKLDREWDRGMRALEDGRLRLWLFDEEDYTAINHFLTEAQVPDAADETYDQSGMAGFVDKVVGLVNGKMDSEPFRGRVTERLTTILDEESVDAQFLSFVLRLRFSMSNEAWLAESGNYVMMRSLFADIRPEEEDDDADGKAELAKQDQGDQ